MILFYCRENSLRKLTYDKLRLIKKESFADKSKGFSSLLE